MLTAGVVLAVMVLPIISAISREVFAQVPALHREAALALGATRWEMIRLAVLPYGRSESSGIDVNTLIASGLALFVVTFAVNMLARAIVNRRAEFSGANA